MTAYAAGTVTNCTYAGAGGLQAALTGGGTVTFACDGTIVVPQISISADTEINATGHTVTLNGNNANRVFVVASSGNLTLESITIANGQGPTGFSGCPNYCGGGVLVNAGGQLTVRGSIFSDNSADSGGAINSNHGTLLVENSEFVRNKASSGRGGAILTTRVNANAVSTTIAGTTFRDNSAGRDGGALAIFVGTGSISNSTFHGNVSGGDGGAIIHWSDGSLSVDSATIAENSARRGGGFRILGAGPTALKNTIVYGNSASTGPDIYGPVTSNDHNLIGTTSGATITPQANDIIGQDPLLGPLANNGGTTQTRVLLPGSPAIDTGNTTLTTDQRGEPRPHGLADDIGAYESQANGTIIIAKQTAPLNQGDFDFTHNITATTTFTLAGGQSQTFLNVAPGTYTVTEAIEPLWRLVDLRCDDDASARPSSGSTITRTATIAVEPGETVTCTFTNSQDDIIIVQKRTLPSGGTGFDFTVGGELTGTFTLDDGQLQVLDVISGSYTISETDRSPAYTLDSIECTIFGPGPNDEAAVNGNKTTGSVDMALTTGQAAFCLFTNLKAGSITIVKSADPADNTPFDFGITGGRGADVLLNEAFTLRDPLTTTKTFTDVVPGAYALGEDPVTGWSPRTINCDSPGTSSYDYFAPGEVSIALAPGDDVTCTFENVKLGTLTIVKDADPADNTPFTYDIVSANPLSPTQFSLQDPLASTRTYTDIFPQGYTVSEQAVAGWSLADITCQSTLGTSNFVVDRAQREVLVVLAAGDDATCTFINKKNGSITIVKDADPADDTPFDFGITGGPQSDRLNETFTLQDPLTTTKTFTDVAPGTYALGEYPGTGWSPRTINCDSTLRTSSYDYFAPGEVSIALAPGDDVTCTFENVKLGTLTIVKDADPADNTPFTYDIVSANPLSPTQFSLQDPLASTRIYTDVFPQGYTVSEQAVAGWSLADITCQSTLGTSNFVVDRAQREVLVVLAAGDDATCTFINKKNGSITLIKGANPADNTRFHIVVADPGNNLADYYVQDPTAPTFTFAGLPGLYHVRESVAPGWLPPNTVCQSTLGTSTFDNKHFGPDINLAQGDAVTCTLHNVKPGSLTVVKNSVGGDANFDIASTALGNFPLVTSNGTAQKSFGPLQPGAYDLAEVAPPGWRLASATCSDGSNPASVAVDAGEDVTCTFTNYRLNTIVIEKRTVGADGTFEYLSPKLSNFQLKTVKGVARRNFNNLIPGVYAVTENVPAGWTATVADPTCTNGDKASSINLRAGETVVCVFVNLKQDAIVVEKRTVGGDGSFDFASNLPNGAAFNLTTAKGVASQAFANLPPATYNVSETVPDGWVQSGATCSNGSNTAGVSLAPGATVSCVFTNTKLSTITVVKRSAGGDGDFVFKGDLGNFALSTTAGSAQQIFTNLAAGAYNISETVPAGWDLVVAKCSDGSDPASLDLAPGEQVTCTFDNVKRGSLTVVKSATGSNTNFAFKSQKLGDFTIATSGGKGQHHFSDLKPGSYDLAETVPAGWRLDFATCSNGSAPANVVVGSGENVVCTFENTQLDTIVVIQRTVGGNDSFSFTSQALNNFSLTTTNGEAQRSFSNLAPGAYDVTANGVAGWTPAVADPLCSNGDSASNINLKAGETVVCVFESLKQDTIVVEKRTVGGDGSFDFTSNLPGAANFSLTTSNGVTVTAFSNLPAATYTLGESVPAGWVQTGASCDNGDAPASVSLTPGATVSCVFTNTKLAKVVVIKRSTGGDQTFSFMGDLGAFNIKTANGLAKRDFFDLTAGAYAITETVPAGWELSRAVCSDGSSPAALTLGEGDEVTCVFENTKLGGITIVKNTLSGDETFGFVSPDLGNFDLATANGTAQKTFDNLTPAIYSMSENVPAGWGLASASCSNGDSPAAISLGAGEQVTCTFENVSAVSATTGDMYLPLVLLNDNQNNATGN